VNYDAGFFLEEIIEKFMKAQRSSSTGPQCASVVSARFFGMQAEAPDLSEYLNWTWKIAGEGSAK